MADITKITPLGSSTTYTLNARILGQTSSTDPADKGGLTWNNLSGVQGTTINAYDTPSTSAAWWYILRNRHTNTGNNYYTDVAIPFNANSIYYKRVGGSTGSETISNASTNNGWVQVLDQLNYTTYTVKKDGTGASGTWGISISGNAATATTATSATSATTATTATKLAAGAGSATQPVYVNSSGQVVAATAYSSATVGRATNANYLNNASHSVTLTNSTWGASNPWGCGSRTLVWGQQGKLASASSDTADMVLYYGTSSASGGAGWFLHIDGGYWSMGPTYGAVWNDYAECRNIDHIEPGRCIKEVGDDTMILTTKRLERGCSVVSDTAGHVIGYEEKSNLTTPVAVAGRVLVYPYEDREVFRQHIGWPVCSGPNGTVSIMTEEEEEKYPSRIVGTISGVPDYEIWGTGKIKVNGRVWIVIK